jgi:alkylated DNA repair dioxygenase AlkB
METLFPARPIYPAGFTYIPAFLSENEEQQLLSEISNLELHVFKFQGFEAKRKVASFGYDYSFDKRALSKGKEIPAAFDVLIDKVANHLLINKEDFAELLVTEYPVGSVINWHRDAFPFDLIAGISLLSDCTFRLRPHDKTKQDRSAIISVPVKSRSLYVMRGMARTEWQHSISPVKAVRYSITLRTLRKTVR